MSRNAWGSILVFCFSALILSLVANAQNEDYCNQNDYVRQSTPCDEATKVRHVTYVKARNCTDAFQYQGDHVEPCDCTPEDYATKFAVDAATNKCSAYYVPTDCDGGITSASMMVDEIFCELELQPCTEANIRSTYSTCDFARNAKGVIVSAMPSVEVVYYFDNECNPYVKGSARLPPSTYIPCDTKCGAGHYIHGETCEACKPGTFSLGGGVRYENFEELDKQVFKTSCTFTNSSGTFKCYEWYASESALRAGAYDGPNNWFQDECATDTAYDCHNNLKATLQMNVKLVRDGFVKFKYTVSSEKHFDGLSFWIDDSDKPVMALDSYQFHPKEVTFNLTAGYHLLTWLYSKDEKWTQGQDMAGIFFIEVDGTGFNDKQCEKCPIGTHSPAGAVECLPCPMDTTADEEGTAQCKPCPQGTYSLSMPRVKCLPKPACNVSRDATSSYTACDATQNTRTRVWSWLEPHVCEPDAVHKLPENAVEPCPPCPSGLVSMIDRVNNTRSCVYCPAGTARDANTAPSQAAGLDSCEPCPPGSVAIKQLRPLYHHDLNGQMPSGFLTGCSGDCATPGWRVEHNRLSSGAGHGKSVSVWLSMNITIQYEGQVSFNFSVDIPKHDSERGLFFYIDDNLTDDIEDGGYEGGEVAPTSMTSGPWLLGNGSHSLMWVWVKLDAGGAAHSDMAIIYDITIDGAGEGGAASCQRVPEGAFGLPGNAAWAPCPAGTFSAGGTTNCTNCPVNTFNPDTYGGPWACTPCGSGTTALEGSSECFVGDVDIPSSFCTFSPNEHVDGTEVEDTVGMGGGVNMTLPTMYDLSPLARLHPGRPFGPVYNDPLSKNKDRETIFYVNVCEKDMSNDTCRTFDGKPMNTYMCRVDTKTALSKKLTYNLGKSFSLHSLGEGSGARNALMRRGFHMVYKGDVCQSTQGVRITNITFICDPDAGYGLPEAWTDQGFAAAFNPSLPFPTWVVRSGINMPISSPNGCDSTLVWYSAYACPMCSFGDYDMVQVLGCVDNKYITYKYREPKTCQTNPLVPLPEDILCEPCNVAEYDNATDPCVDSEGKHNVTFRWLEPKTCNDELPGSAQLPEDIIVGACEQRVIIMGAGLAPKYVFLIALSGVLIVFLSVVALVTWLKSRRLYSMYSKLVEQGGAEEGGAGGGEGGLGGRPDHPDDDEDEFGEIEKRGEEGEKVQLAAMGKRNGSSDDV